MRAPFHVVLTTLCMSIPSTTYAQSSVFSWPYHHEEDVCSASVNATVSYLSSSSGERRLGLSVVITPRDNRNRDDADPCYVYGDRLQCCDYLETGCFSCDGCDYCNSSQTCVNTESYQCYSYTEAQGSIPEADIIFEQSCMSQAKEESINLDWIDADVTVTKYYSPVLIYLEAKVPNGMVVEGKYLNISVAFSICSANVGCYDQYLFGTRGTPPLELPLLMPSEEEAALTESATNGSEFCSSSAGGGDSTANGDSTQEEDDDDSGGTDLGAILALPAVVAVFTVIFLLLACSLFGGFKMELPPWALERLNQVYMNQGRSTCSNPFSMAFLRGLLFGLMVSPCVGPFAASMLVYIAATGNIMVGAVGLLFFSFGLSTLLLLMALSAGLAARFPKPGPWLDLLKKHCAFVVLVMACVFLNSLGDLTLTCVTVTVTFGLWMVYTAASVPLHSVPIDELPFEEMAAVTGVRRWLPYIKRREEISRRRITLSAMLLAALPFVYYFMWSYSVSGKLFPPLWPPGELLEGPPSKIEWVYDYDEAVAEASAQNKPLFVDFYADWCIPCRAMDYDVLADDEVVVLAASYVSYKADCTKGDSAGSELKNDEWNIRAMPAYVFITAATIREKASAGEALEPEVTLKYTQTVDKMVEVMEAVLRGETTGLEDSDDFEDSAEKDIWGTILLCYAWGLMASLTPCVYPMIPTTLAMFAGDEAPGNMKASDVVKIPDDGAVQGSLSPADLTSHHTSVAGDGGLRIKIACKAILYACGIAVTYTSLGIIVTVFI
ncbi:hypothetical protein CYMTET_48259 [Cymbomonas tetramitiformis]|uniref:Thioredoxin domain-containing protein n=1 Tax=Cymbomonas tetramitiformis TaxID=36881 RepID=A0AAE0BTP8_9CHLO|nr:hypothetical protein CYMTET_48259 [Cymbomonas tetramitiformis]